jgi:hypothetical protein
MVTEYFAFPDLRDMAREGVPFIGMRHMLSADGTTLLERLHMLDLDHPMTVVFREYGNPRWSHATVVPRSREEPDDPQPQTD